MSAQWLPKGFHTVTPNIVVDDAEQAVAFFKIAFGASESYRLTMSNGKKPQGLFTLIFRKFPEGWKIVHDHSAGE